MSDPDPYVVTVHLRDQVVAQVATLARGRGVEQTIRIPGGIRIDVEAVEWDDLDPLCETCPEDMNDDGSPVAPIRLISPSAEQVVETYNVRRRMVMPGG